MPIRKKFHDAAGKLCEAVLPIKYEYHLGSGKELAICTLSSMDLLEEISKSDLMNHIAIAGRLLSENRGIDAMIRFVIEHRELRRIIVCGNEVKGHRAGQALIALMKNGIDGKGRIVGAAAPYPIIKSQAQHVEAFRSQLEVVDMTGITDIKKLIA